MRLRAFSDYSLRVLIYLAVRGHRLSTRREIASAYGVSDNHLRKVVHHLVRHGYIEATRGRGGGIRLSRPPADINIGAILRESEVMPERAWPQRARASGCCRESLTMVDAILRAGAEALFATLERHTLADLLVTRSRLAAALIQPEVTQQPDGRHPRSRRP